MKVLFLGGTGIISRACSELALARGAELWLLNRGGRPPIPGARTLQADLLDIAGTAQALGEEHFDAVVDFIAFSPADVEPRIELFRQRTSQYVFISSASAYQKPPVSSPVTESTPLENPFWDYSRHKIDCEALLQRAHRESGFPMTIVRPSYTYGDTVVPLALNVWGKTFTVVDRMRRGQPVIVPGDGLSLWTMTHNSDFAKGLLGLLGRRDALGEAFHITSDEALTWDQIYRAVAEAAGVSAPKLVHLSSDFITACLPETVGTLLGDKSNSAVFDNRKIKAFVPDFSATTSFRDGIRKTIAWFDADPARRLIDHQAEQAWDAMIAAHERAQAMAVLAVQSVRSLNGRA